MKYRVAKSKIHGDGVFATQPIAKGEYISDTPDYIDNVNQTIASSFHNHDEKNPNVLNVEKGNQRFLIAKRGIEVGEELTADYNLTPSPPFEDPNDFKDLDERELPLSDEEAQEMLNAGFVLEEMQEGGEDDNLITYKNNKNLIDSVANWDMQSDVDISSDYNDQIKARLLTGNFGYNTKTGELVKLDKSEQTIVKDKDARETRRALKKLKEMQHKDEDASFKDLYGQEDFQREDFTGNFLSPYAVGHPVFFGKGGPDDRIAKDYRGGLSDLYRYYGGLPLQNNILQYSKTAPTDAKDKDAKYISLNKDQVFLDEVWKNYLRVKSGNLSTTSQGDKEQKVKDGVWRVSGYSSGGPDHHITEKPFDKHHSNAIGRYKISEGKDDKGHFIQYYDKFDQGTGSGDFGDSIYDFVEGVTNARKPFEIYDRIYYNPQTMERTYKEDFKEGGYILEEMHEGGSPHKHPHEDEVTITGSRRKDPSNLSLEQRQQAYDDSVVLYNSGRRNKHFAENLAMFIEGADNSHINYVKSHFDDNIAKEKAFAKEAHDRLMRLNRFIKGDLHEEKAPTTGDLYETIRWEEYSDYKPKGKRPKSSFDLNDPYEFGLHVNERLGKAFDEMTKQDMVGDEMYGDIDNYSSFYRNNYKARSDKYDLQGNNYNFASGVRDYDEEQLKGYIDLYKEFIDGYQNAIDKGEEKDYTKRYLKSYKDIVSTLEEVLDSPIKPKSVIYNPELAPIYIYDKPTYKQAYKNVDKDKYPTYEDFEFAADYYNKTGTNPDFQDLPSNRLAPPPEPEYEVNDIEPEIEIDRLPIVKSKLNLDASLPEELEGVDYVLDKKGNISGFIKADPGKTGNRKRNYRKLKRSKKERALDDLNEGLQYKHGGSHDPPSYKDGGPKVKQRRGVRKNPDGSVSSHLMRAEYIPEIGWVAFPSLFQDDKPYADDQQNWVDMSEEEDWMKVYKEAERRGEVYYFGEDKEAALAFGEGSWKDQLPERKNEEELYNMKRARELGYERDGSGHLPSVDEETGMFLKSMDHPTAFKEYMYGQLNKDIGTNTRVVVNPEGPFGDKQLQYVELTDEEAGKYRAGGYVLEEIPTYNEGGLVKYNRGGKFLTNKVAPVVIEPGIKLIETFFPGIGRSAGAKISRMSMGDARYNYKDIINDLFREKSGKNEYYGQDGILSPSKAMLAGMGPDAISRLEKINDYYGEDKRDLVRQYFFGDSNNMTETAWKSHLEGDDPLGDMIKRHGPLKAFKMFSEIGAGKPLNAYELAEQMEIRRDHSSHGYESPLYDSKVFRAATGWKPNSGHTPINEPNVFLESKQGLIDIYEDQFKRFGTDVLPFDINPASTNSKGERVKRPPRSLSYNPIRPHDDVAGHMTYLQRHGLGDYSLTSRDAWHFSPKSYNSKWYDKEGYLENLPARLMDKFGKPFVLTQTNPISFDFDLFERPTKSKLKLKKGGLVKYNGGGGIDSKLKVRSTFDKEKVDELRLRHKQFEDENPDVKKVSFEQWLNYQLMDQRTPNNPDAKRKFTDYMVINEDGTASVYDGQEIQNRIYQHGRKNEQLIDAGLPEGDHSFLQEHVKRATANGEIRYMNHIKKGLSQGMTMDEIKKDMLSQNLISEAGWNEKYEGKTAEHINTQYDKVQNYIKEFNDKFNVTQGEIGSKIDPALMNAKQLQMDSRAAYDYVEPDVPAEVNYQRIPGTAHAVPMTKIPLIKNPVTSNPNPVLDGEALFNKNFNPAGLPSTSYSWSNLTEKEKQDWNRKAIFEDIKNKSDAYKKTTNEYIGDAANQMYNQNIQSDFDNNQLDPRGRYIGEGNLPFINYDGDGDEIDALDFVPWTEQEIANNELNNKTQLINSYYNRDFDDQFKSEVVEKFSPDNYITIGKDDWGNQIVKKADYNSNNTVGAQRRIRDSYNFSYNPTMQHSGRTGWVDPVKWIMGPGAGAAGLFKNIAGRGLKNISKILQKNPVNWASRNLIGKELPGWLNYATTPANIISADFAYQSFKPDGFVPNLAEGIQDVYQETPGGRKKIVDNSWGLFNLIPAYRGAKALKNLKGQKSFFPTSSNFTFGATSPSGRTQLSFGNPNIAGDPSKYKDIKNIFSINLPGQGGMGLGRYKAPGPNPMTSNLLTGPAPTPPVQAGLFNLPKFDFKVNHPNLPSGKFTDFEGQRFFDFLKDDRMFLQTKKPSLTERSSLLFKQNITKPIGNKFTETFFPTPKQPTAADQMFEPYQTVTRNPVTGNIERHNVNLPTKVIPGRPYEGVKHKMPFLVNHPQDKSFLGRKIDTYLKTRVPGFKDKHAFSLSQGNDAMTFNPRTGGLMDSNTRYWANRLRGIDSKPDQFFDSLKRDIAEDQGEFVGFGYQPKFAPELGVFPRTGPKVKSYDEGLDLKLTSKGKQPFTGFNEEAPYLLDDGFTGDKRFNFRGRTLSQKEGTKDYSKLLTKYPALNLNTPSVYFHGTTSGTLPGFSNLQGLMNQGALNKAGVVPMSGENFLGAQGINQDLLSTVDFKNINEATQYSLMDAGRSPGKNFSDWWGKNRLEYVKNYSPKGMLPAPEFYDELYTKGYEQYEKASDMEKSLLDEKFPVMFGINPTKGDASRFVIPRSDISGEMGIKGKVDFSEIPQIFVPRSKMDIAREYLPNEFSNKISPIDPFFQSNSGEKAWGNKLRMQQQYKDLGYKKGGFIDVELTDREALMYAQNGYIIEEVD